MFKDVKKGATVVRVSLLLSLSLASVAPAAEQFATDPEAGNNTMSAVFEAPLGERISATSSQVACTVTWDEKASTVSGTCKVPLKSIMVDNEPTKTEHFQQWVTQKKTEPAACSFETKFDKVKVEPALAPGKPSQVKFDAPFTVCGRARSDGGKEHVEGTLALFPAGQYGETRTVKLRAKIEKFSREKYKIGAKYTDGWLARVQQLANVVADEGNIELSLFGKSKAEPAAPAK